MEYFLAYFSGRIARLQYLSGIILSTVGMIIFLIVMDMIVPSRVIVDFFESITSIVYGVFALSISVRRFHDYGRSGWFVILLFVPLANIYFSLELLLKAGDPKANVHGKPSKKYYPDLFTPYAK